MFYHWLFHFLDVDECMSDNGGCEKQCVNKDGSYKCLCGKGEVLMADKKTCAGIVFI